jgi:acyl-CoA thioester hydrolase
VKSCWGLTIAVSDAGFMNRPLSEHSVVLQQDVIWGDMDAFGHVNNTVYFRYFEDARIAYFDRIGAHEIKEELNIGPILATTHADFKLPLEYPDRILIAGWSTILGLKKFNMHYRVYNDRFDAIAAEGEGLLVYYDYANGASCEIPEKVITAIGALEA